MKLFFGHKITKWAEKKMDDSVQFTPMRARLDIAKIFKMTNPDDRTDAGIKDPNVDPDDYPEE